MWMPADRRDCDVLIREKPLGCLFGLRAAQILPIEDDGKLSDMLLDRPTRFRTNHYCYSFNHLHSPSSRALHRGLFSLVKPKPQYTDQASIAIGAPLHRTHLSDAAGTHGARNCGCAHHPNMGDLTAKKRH
ncbi:hypothetical protein VSR17_07370 [Cupriavidus taiwanensis]|uniref:hypothetical protein n=1 Tax=Cupriavidus taiwanensis TaxID=164546 RepID=UPI0011C080A7|nr:hypothetical protein [Cupriavidus taiwanensis]